MACSKPPEDALGLVITEPSTPAEPHVEFQDLGNGRVRLTMRGGVSWPTALAIARTLAEPDCADDDDGDESGQPEPQYG